MNQGRFNLAEDSKIMSAIDQLRDRNAPSVIDGEEVIKRGQAAFDGGSAAHSTWKMGSLYLTEKKLVFFQGNNRLFDIPLDCIDGVSVLERGWIPGRLVKQLCIIKNLADRKTKLYVWARKPEQWKEAVEGCLQSSV